MSLAHVGATRTSKKRSTRDRDFIVVPGKGKLCFNSVRAHHVTIISNNKNLVQS